MSIDGPGIPMPPSLDDSALRRMIADCRRRALEEGIRETMRPLPRARRRGPPRHVRHRRRDRRAGRRRTRLRSRLSKNDITMAQQQSASATSIGEVAVIVSAADNVAVVKTAVDAGLALEAPGRPHRDAHRRRSTPGHRFATRADPGGRVRAAVRPADRHVAGGIAEGDPITVRNMTQRRAGRARPAGRPAHRARPTTSPRVERGDVARLPASRRPGRHAQLRADRADEHVREPRVAADRDDRRVHAVLAARSSRTSTASSRSRTTRAAAAPTARTSRSCCGRCRTTPAHPNVGGVIFIGLGCEKTNLTAVEKYLQKEHRRSRQARRPLRHPGGGRHAGRDRARPEGSRRRCCRASTRRRAATRRCHELILGVKCGGSDGFSGLSANPALGRAADLLVRSGGTVLITEVPEFCGAEHILAQRAKDRDHGRSGLPDGGLVQGLRLEVRDGAEREPEPGQRRRRPAQHHDQVARRHRQGRDDARRGRHRVRASCPQGHGALADAGARLRPGIDAGSRRGRRAGRGVHDGSRHDDRQRHRAGGQARVQHARLQRMSRDMDLSAGRHHRRHRDRSTKSARGSSSTSAASPAARCRRRRKRPSIASSGSGPNSRCHS